MSKTEWDALPTISAEKCAHTMFSCDGCGSVVYQKKLEKIDPKEFERLALLIQEGVEESGLTGEEELGPTS